MLKQALAVNAAFSGLSGLLIIWFNEWMARHFPGPDWLWTVVGVGLLLFAAQLIAMVVNPAFAKKLTPQVVVSDIGWVALTLLGLAVFFADITTTGVALILAINAVVGTLAVLQHIGYRRDFA